MLINLHRSLQNFRNDRQSVFIVNNLFSGFVKISH